jgi:site-specific DNA-methyltransferase (adenine-specific)
LVESELIHGDCLIELPKIFDKKIDLVLTDPPYGTTQCKWDSIIPFEPMWNQLKRVIKDNGAIALFGSEPFSSYLRTSNIEWFKYDWYWNKKQGTGFLNSKKYPLKNIETISVFCKKPHKYNPQMRVGKPYKIKSGQGSLNYGNQVRVVTENNGVRYPLTLIEFNRDKNKLHSTQKPVALLEYLIKTYTNENDTVLDFTMGSGSTGVACKNLNRNFIGIEKDDKYFDIAKQRIEGVLI